MAIEDKTYSSKLKQVTVKHNQTMRAGTHKSLLKATTMLKSQTSAPSESDNSEIPIIDEPKKKMPAYRKHTTEQLAGFEMP